jgi:hypothetical protein
LLFVGNLLTAVVYSTMRGTDGEAGILIVVAGSTILVWYARYLTWSARRIKLTRWAGWAVVIAILIALASWVFVDRKEARVGGTDEYCFSATGVCANYDKPILSAFGVKTKFGITMLASYLTQGYYGLSLALRSDFQSTWGLGHSPFITSIYSRLTGDEKLYERSYVFKLRSQGWDDLGRWSTAFPWFANDVGFAGALAIVGVAAWVWGASWKDAALGSDTAAAVFALSMIFFAYLPANSQLTLNADLYCTTLYWIGMWWWRRRAGLPRPSAGQ